MGDEGIACNTIQNEKHKCVELTETVRKIIGEH